MSEELKERWEDRKVLLMLEALIELQRTQLGILERLQTHLNCRALYQATTAGTIKVG